MNSSPAFTRAHMLAELGAATCYRKLPTALRTRLYRRFGHGYEEAYHEARAALSTV